MKNHNILLATTMILLVLISVILFYSANDSTNKTVDNEHFRILNTGKINRVTMANVNDNIELSYKNNRWLVNGNHNADEQLIKVLFATMQQVSTRRPVSLVERDSVFQLLKLSGTSVAFFEGEELRMKFIAGGNEDKTKSWFLKSEEKEPFLMSIPGYHVYVSGIFELDVSGWRNKHIFDFNWIDFKSLSAVVMKDSSMNFNVEMKGDQFGIRQIEEVDIDKMNSYLDDLSILYASKLMNYNALILDSLLESRPISLKIEIMDRFNTTYSLEILSSSKRDKEVYGIFNRSIIFLIDKEKVRRISKGRNFFKSSGLPQ